MRVDSIARKTVVYVGAYLNGSFIPTGTGFFVGVRYRDNDFNFFITADHVLDLIEGDKVFIYLICGLA